MDINRVLVTGMSGLIGGIMHRTLADKYELIALNRRDVAGVNTHQADIADLAAIRPAFDLVNDLAIVYIPLNFSEYNPRNRCSCRLTNYLRRECRWQPGIENFAGHRELELRPFAPDPTLDPVNPFVVVSFKTQFPEHNARYHLLWRY